MIDSDFSPCPKIAVSIRAAEITDVSELKTLTSGYKKRDFSQWIKDGYIIYVAQLRDNRIVGYVCVCPAIKSKHKLISILKLKDTDYWAVDAFIHPEYRRKGINSAIASGFIAQAKSQGYKRGFGTILFKNNASRKSYAFIGEKELGIFTTITIMGFSFHFLKRNAGHEEYFN